MSQFKTVPDSRDRVGHDTRETSMKTSSNHYYLYIIVVFRHPNKFRCPMCKNIVGNI